MKQKYNFISIDGTMSIDAVQAKIRGHLSDMFFNQKTPE